MLSLAPSDAILVSNGALMTRHRLYIQRPPRPPPSVPHLHRRRRPRRPRVRPSLLPPTVPDGYHSSLSIHYLGRNCHVRRDRSLHSLRQTGRRVCLPRGISFYINLLVPHYSVFSHLLHLYLTSPVFPVFSCAHLPLPAASTAVTSASPSTAHPPASPAPPAVPTHHHT